MDPNDQIRSSQLEEAFRAAQPAWAKTPNVLGEPVPVSRVDSVQNSQDYSISEFSNTPDVPDATTPFFAESLGGTEQGGSGATLPFTVEVRNNGTDVSPDWEARVLSGKGRRSLAYDSGLTIGLLNSWEDITTSTKIWLEFQIDYDDGNFVVDSSDIVYDNSFWTEYPIPLTFVGTSSDEQSRYYLLIATFDDDDGTPVPIQEWTGNFIMKNFCYQGKPAIRPENWGG
jgi:hypothetical protein